MSVETSTVPSGLEAANKKAAAGTFARVAKYTLSRVATLFLTVVVGVFLTIMIANMGGYVDTIMRGEIRERISMQMLANPAASTMSPAQRDKMVLDKIAQEEER